ncbi:MAG: glycerophosphodiester phosphodiesterase [Eubacteriales bacterium]|nr:glycerophosphodiester phosphodiesterase [Eubacteriales bacterium]
MNTKIYAHRGASGYAPENTLAAFSLAVEQNADGVELDVQLTRDKQLVVVHDERIDRVSDGTGRVCDISLRSLKKLKFGINHMGYENEQMPTLEEVFDLLKDTKLNINIELKNSILPYEGLEEYCLELSAKKGMEDRIVYSSFNHYSMLRLKKMNPYATCGILYNCCIINPWDYAKKIGVDAIHPHFGELTLVPEECEKAHKLNIAVNTWTVNEEADMQHIMMSGADILITNYPDRAIALAQSLFNL